MVLDSSFRSRVREALRHSAVRQPAPGADGSPPVPPEDDALSDVARAAPRTADTDTPPAGDSPVVHELRYEPEDEPRQRADSEQEAWIAELLGGRWQRSDAGVCLVVDRTFPAGQKHGDAEIIEYADALTLHRAGLSRLGVHADTIDARGLFAGLDAAATPNCPLLFFDLETTGLSGGAGICAFLVGFGWFEHGSFRTRQYFLSGYGHEAAMLRMAAATVPGTTLVSFNGKAFDVPLIDGRYLFHRVPSPFDGIPHIDLLHPARRLWRHRPSVDRSMDQDRRDAFARYFRMTRSADAGSMERGYGLSARAASCALGALEEAVLGFRRVNDVPGADIPARFFHYVRSGDVRPLAPVFEHNRLDLVSLAALSGIVARMLAEGAGAARNAHECLALGSLFERAGSTDRAVACYKRAVEEHDDEGWQTDLLVEREALRRLALRRRRERRYDEAAATWQRLLDLPSPGRGAGLDLEAARALAVHYEHRARNLQAAHALVLRALDGTRNPSMHESLRYRLARLERKLGVRPNI
jgi:uncharacterized protein YprB with RNaseH-like and TPR domain